eukprot:5784335-Pleurochrysis_carterae.AAC.1
MADGHALAGGTADTAAAGIAGTGDVAGSDHLHRIAAAADCGAGAGRLAAESGGAGRRSAAAAAAAAA